MYSQPQGGVPQSQGRVPQCPILLTRSLRTSSSTFYETANNTREWDKNAHISDVLDHFKELFVLCGMFFHWLGQSLETSLMRL
jgi:hypothetical protein